MGLGVVCLSGQVGAVVAAAAGGLTVPVGALVVRSSAHADPPAQALPFPGCMGALRNR